MFFQDQLKKLTDKLLVREIKSREGEVVFRRWRLLRTPWFQVFVHAIYAADRDYFLHDHPWNFTSLVLKGGYQDDYHNEDDRKQYFLKASLIQKIRSHKRWSINRMKARGEYHRIRRLYGSPVWTLVVAGPSIRKWGYLTPKGWINNESYRQLKNEGHIPDVFWSGVYF